MGSVFQTIALAATAALTTMAYRHPDAYWRLLPYLNGLYLIAVCGMIGFNFGVWTTESAALTVAVTDVAKIHEAINATVIPWMSFLVAGASLSYLGLLSMLPRLGITAK